MQKQAATVIACLLLIASMGAAIGVFSDHDYKGVHGPINVKTPVNNGDAVPKSYATNASNLASGTVGTARLGSGTASSSTYLRGDQTWASVTAGAGSWNTMTDGATVTLTWSHDSTNVVTLGGNRTLAISGTPALNQKVRIRLTQDATGSRTLTWPTSGVTIKWPLGEVPVLTTTAAKTDTVELTCTDATGGALVFAGVILSMNEG